MDQVRTTCLNRDQQKRFGSVTSNFIKQLFLIRFQAQTDVFIKSVLFGFQILAFKLTVNKLKYNYLCLSDNRTGLENLYLDHALCILKLIVFQLKFRPTIFQRLVCLTENLKQIMSVLFKQFDPGYRLWFFEVTVTVCWVPFLWHCSTLPLSNTSLIKTHLILCLLPIISPLQTP